MSKDYIHVYSLCLLCLLSHFEVIAFHVFRLLLFLVHLKSNKNYVNACLDFSCLWLFSEIYYVAKERV